MSVEWRYVPASAGWVLAAWGDEGGVTEVFADAVPASRLTAVAPRARCTVAVAMMHEYGIVLPADAFDGAPGARVSVTCPLCWRVSFDPGAARSRRCPSCPPVEDAAPAVEGAESSAGAS